ncbi:MAG: hypothetical protein IJY43_01915 [Clostridia bacterium]|nr:hypothetical protein [Clostridia bacterium]
MNIIPPHIKNRLEAGMDAPSRRQLRCCLCGEITAEEQCPGCGLSFHKKESIHTCSACGLLVYAAELPSFCPVCGMKF